MTGTAGPAADPAWVEEILLSGAGGDVCLDLGGPVTRAALRELVDDRARALADAGLRPGGAVALNLAPSVAFIGNLLAAWRLGAQAALLDHRLTEYEVDLALKRLLPQVVVRAATSTGGPLRGYADVTEAVTAYPGQPAATPHAVIQLSSGSTGPSKVIGRRAESLIEEVRRYTLIDGVPREGETIVSLASMVHVLGLVGGLLYGLHAGVTLVIPPRMTADGILATVAAQTRPTTILGVPFHIELLASVRTPPAMPLLTGMTTGGELVRPDVYADFTDRYGVRLGNMYGMTEVGVIGTDLFGRDRPAIRPAPGFTVKEEGGELHIALPESPYLGDQDPARWSDGWLHTRDAGSVDPATGLVRVLGRRDSQVSVGGLKVDLTEVEHTLAALPEVAAVVVAHDTAIEAFVVLAPGADAAAVEREVVRRLSPSKRPRRTHYVEQLPRTATGKLVRDLAALRAVRPGAATGTPHQDAAGPAGPHGPSEGNTGT